MTDDEKKLEQERVKEEKYKAQNMLINRMYAENIFSKSGFKEEDYSTILDSIVQEDAEKTKTLAQTICQTMKKQKENAEKEIKDKFVNGTVTPPAGDGSSTQTTQEEQYKQAFAEAQSKNDFAKMAYYTRLIQQNSKK